jgi:hypothetical protein
MLLATLVSLSHANTGLDMEHVLAFDIPTSATGVGMGDAKVLGFYREATHKIAMLPGVEGAAVGSFVPWRDAGGATAPRVQFTVEGYQHADGEEDPRTRLRMVAPGFFTVLGIPLGLVGLATLVPLSAMGFVAGALVFGRLLVREPRSLVVAFLAGWAILRVVDLVPGLGNLASFAATVYGLGALAVAAWRARAARATPATVGPPPAAAAPSNV